MSALENHYRKMFDQSTGSVLGQIKFALRILQWQGYKGQSIEFLLTLESILEAGSQEESVRTKLLRVLQPEKDEPGSVESPEEDDAVS